MSKEIQREVVSIGLDFRPIRLDVGDGQVWEFQPEPEPAQFDRLISTMKSFSKIGEAMQDNGAQEESSGMTNALDELRKALGALLVDQADRSKFMKQKYGLRSLNALCNAVIEETTGFTGKSPKGSGKG